ncbi:centriolin isoform X2 [Polypterus senegalus]|uniref:centriolin isoform X2 n=1 Tax=Polypterus senegalus TaxID=55291 RepID=UPI0019663DFA|nr:centriolin isoform X2 [Polypterus senegalus]
MKKSKQQKATGGKVFLSPPRSLSPGSSLSNPRTRTPSPVSFPKAIGQQVTFTEESDAGGSELQENNGEKPNPGIRYLTEGLIKKISQQENLALVQSLNLSLAKSGGKKLKFIENLEKLEKLQILHLSNNMIQKIEKLDKQLKLKELHLSNNQIRKIEGLEHMTQLKHLNLSGNEIENVPAWVGKKLRSLQTLNLRQNRISSLYDITKLKPLKDLTKLVLAENPLATLPHYRLFVVFHLRSVEFLDEQPVTEEERQLAHERFHLEEVERLEQELEKRLQEIKNLQEEQSMALEELNHQEEMNKSLQNKAEEQKQMQMELEREMGTKNELLLSWLYIVPHLSSLCPSMQLKQKTAELTRACQKQYELEQELAFYKIDAKFEPFPFVPNEEMALENSPDESPYIGKAKYKRNAYARESYVPEENPKQATAGKLQMNLPAEAQSRLQDTLDAQKLAEERLMQLQKDIGDAEQQILRATEELRQLEETVSQKRISEAEKEHLRQQLHRKIQLLTKLRQEAEDLEHQMERQRAEMTKKQAELDELQKTLNSLDPSDPRHAHVKAQMVNKSQQLDMMSKEYRELENRLDEMLARIAKETEEIKDLEQQLTEGQIAANEALKRDLEGIIAGLQEYLKSVKNQARQTSEECRQLKKEREALLTRLAKLEDERNQMEVVALDADSMRQELLDLRRTSQQLQKENEQLKKAQGDLSAYEAELEVQLQERDTEANQLKDELARQRRLSQMEHSALQAELNKERQALENARAQAQQATEREQDNKELQAQLKKFQVENSSLKEKLEELQNQMEKMKDTMLEPEEVTTRIEELRRKVQTGVGEIRPYSSKDIIGKSLSELQQELEKALSRSEKEKDDAVRRQNKLTQEMATLREKMRKAQDNYKAACDEAAEAKIEAEKQEAEMRILQLEKEVDHLQEKLHSMENLQALTDQQLQNIEDERDKLQEELEHQDKKMKLEDSKTQKKLMGLDQELSELKKSMLTVDKAAARQLSNTKRQLKSLHGTIHKLNQERAEEMNELEAFRAQAEQAARDLNRADEEISLLQRLLQDREKQMLEQASHTNDRTLADTFQQLELEKLSKTLDRQRAEIERLRDLLGRARDDNPGYMERLMDEIRALRNTVAQQNDFMSNVYDPVSKKGYWCYVPSPPNPPSIGSQGTRDSGLGSQNPASPSRGCSHGQHGRREADDPEGGYWIYSPNRNHRVPGHRGGNYNVSDSSRGSGEPGHIFIPPPGSVIYTLLPDGSPVPQGTVVYGPPPSYIGMPVSPGTVVYGPPPSGVHLVYGPPPANFTVPLTPVGVLHCNVPDHHELENKLSQLMKDRKRLQKESKRPETVDGLHGEVWALKEERNMLEKETEELHRAMQRRYRRKDFLEGTIGSLVSELEMEKSLKQQDDVANEIECLEKTLLKRRAELREADRLLTEAESELKTTRERTEDFIQQYSNAKRRLADTEKESEELEKRAQDTATQLVKASKELRILEGDLEELKQYRSEQESVLQEINTVVSARDLEFQTLGQKIENMTEILEKLQEDLKKVETRRTQQLEVLKEVENLISTRRCELEKLNSEVEQQQEELMVLDKRLGQKKEEGRILQVNVEQRRAGLVGVLREGEEEVAELHHQIKELKVELEHLSAQKGELNAQLSEKRAQLTLLKQEMLKEEEALQNMVSQINKHKTELKHVLEMLQLENNELQGIRVQHDQKVNELEKSQVAVLQEKVELQALQQATQRQRAEGERQRQLIEKDRQKLEELRLQAHSLQESVATLSKEKSLLEETCQSLNNKLAQTKRAVATAEENNRTEQCKLEKLESELTRMRQEITQGNNQKQEFSHEASAVQQQIKEKSEELILLQDDLRDTKEQIHRVEEDLQDAIRKRNDLLSEHATLKESITHSSLKYQEHQHEQEKLEQELEQLHWKISDKKARMAQQEKCLQALQTEIEEEQHAKQQKIKVLQEQLHSVEETLAGKQSQLEEVVAQLADLEAQGRRLHYDQDQCAQLEKKMTEIRQQLDEREEKFQIGTRNSQLLREELGTYQNEVAKLQEQLGTERRMTEKKMKALQAERDSDRARLESSLKILQQEKNQVHRSLALAEQAAYDNHERSRTLQKELGALRHKYFRLKEKSQEEKIQRMETRNAMVVFNGDPEKVEPESDMESSEHGSQKENSHPFLEIGRRAESRGVLGLFNLEEEQWRGEALRERLQQQEDHLKAQLRKRMWTQEEAMHQRRQQTEGSLISLRRKVEALDNLVSGGNSGSSAEPYPPLSRDGTVQKRSKLLSSDGQRPHDVRTRDASSESLDVPSSPDQDTGKSQHLITQWS